MFYWCILWNVVWPLCMCFQVFESSPLSVLSSLSILVMYFPHFTPIFWWPYLSHLPALPLPNRRLWFELCCTSIAEKVNSIKLLADKLMSFLDQDLLQWLFYKYFLNLQKSNQKDVFPVGNTSYSLHLRQPALKRFLTSFTFSSLELWVPHQLYYHHHDHSLYNAYFFSNRCPGTAFEHIIPVFIESCIKETWSLLNCQQKWFRFHVWNPWPGRLVSGS